MCYVIILSNQNEIVNGDYFYVYVITLFTFVLYIFLNMSSSAFIMCALVRKTLELGRNGVHTLNSVQQ